MYQIYIFADRDYSLINKENLSFWKVGHTAVDLGSAHVCDAALAQAMGMEVVLVTPATAIDGCAKVMLWRVLTEEGCATDSKLQLLCIRCAHMLLGKQT